MKNRSLKFFALLTFYSLPFLCFSAPVAKNIGGQWSVLGAWPLISIHAVLTPDGKVFSYGTTTTGQQTGLFNYDIWSPNTSVASGHETLANTTNVDTFCSTQLVLPQGDVLVAGGDNYANGGTTTTGNKNVNIFSPQNKTLVPAPAMSFPRWYGSVTTLTDGRTYVQGGSIDTKVTHSDTPEVREINGTFSQLPFTTAKYSWYYPRNFIAPQGGIFGFDKEGQMYSINSSLTNLASLGNMPSDLMVNGEGASAAMFAPGKILVFGGRTKRASVIDINNVNPNSPTPAAPLVTATQPVPSNSTIKRDWVTATVLADGKVLATGGVEVASPESGAYNNASIWNPGTGTWVTGNEGAVPRQYHSIALLLPDASVLVGGGGAGLDGQTQQQNAQIYYPPYLFNSSDQLASRPTITAAPATITPGTNFSVSVGAADTISRVNIVKTGSVTHAWNTEQRFIPAAFTQSGATLTVTPPASVNNMPPGHYMIFVLNSAGVPSVAKIAKNGVATNTALPDIVVTSTSYSNGVFTSTVKNQGTAPTPIQVPVGFSVDGIFKTWGNTTGTLAPGASATLTNIGTGSGFGGSYIIPAGTHTITSYANDDVYFAESNRDNNILTQSITIGSTPPPSPPPAAALPDVVVTSMSYSNGVFTSTVKNQGNAPTPIQVPVGFSVDGVFKTWGNTAGPLAPGASATLTNIGTGGGFGGSFIIPAGTHTITSYANDDVYFAESSRDNNILTQSITVP